MIYAVKLRRNDERVKLSFQDTFYVLVPAKSIEEVNRKATSEYPEHDIAEVAETVYTAIL